MQEPNAESLKARVEELEAKLARSERNREQLKLALFSFMERHNILSEPTEAEIHEMIHGPRGEPLINVIEEIERKWGLTP